MREPFDFIDSLGTVERTSHGFEIINFTDHYNAACSLQASSLAAYEKPGTSAIWLGCDDANPKVLASQAALYGVKTTETTGWVQYPIPDGVSLTTRMHLNREQVAALIKHLRAWLETDTFDVFFKEG